MSPDSFPSATGNPNRPAPTTRRTAYHSPTEQITSCIIAASAGTGKTYQLSLRFIALLALGVPPEHMIALTFTRKAAGEFCDRILRDLADGASSPEQARKLAARIRLAWHGDSATVPLCPGADETLHPLDREHFHRMLCDLTDALGRVRLTTLDSFFFGLLTVSLYDLGIGSIALLDDPGKQQAQRLALESLFNSISDDPRQLQAFQDHFSAFTSSHRGNIREAFDDIIRSHAELFMSAPDETLWHNPQAFHLPDLLSTPQPPRDFYTNAAQEMQTLADSCGASKSLRQGLLAFPGKMAAHDFRSIATVLKNIATPPADASPSLGRMLELASTLYETARRDILRESQQRTLAIFRLMRQYQQHYQAQIRNTGQLDFADITRCVPRLLETQGAPTRLAYRLDSTLEHWMLDEFQDTSQQQWEALLPLLSEILTEAGQAPDHAATRSLFIVGDTKQSIYGWRGASASIFEHLQQTPGLQRMTMSTSWRSAREVLDFVNHVFRYHGTGQEHKPAHTDLSGYVQIRSYDPTGETGDDLFQSIAAILHSLPVAEKRMSIGILTRSNDQAVAIVRWLRQNTGYHVGSLSDITIGTDSPLGETLLSFFRWLAHPSDAYNRAVWYTSPLQPVIEAGGASWQSWRQHLETCGYAAVLRSLQAGLVQAGVQLSAFHQSRMEHWLLSAAAFDRSGGSLPRWIETMQALTQRENPPRHVIQVLTIHKSKGLEYDAVILPFPHTKEPQNTSKLSVLITRNEQNSITGILAPPPTQGQRDLWPQLEPAGEHGKEQQIRENRNLLYVALTRAARANYILLSNKAKAGKEYHASIILDTLNRIANPPPPSAAPSAGPSPTDTPADTPAAATHRPLPISEETTGELFHMGDRQWHQSPPAADAPPPPSGRDPLPPPTPRKTRVSPSASTDHPQPPTGEANTIPELAATRAKAMQLGTEVHALMEQILWWNPDAAPTWYERPATEAERIASAALHHPAIQPLFTPVPGAEAYNEQRLEAVTGTTWTSAVLDRLILYPEQQRAHIIDYKTNRDATGLKELYRPQMQTYRKLVAQATGYPRDHISVTLIHLSDQPTLLHYTESDWKAPAEQNQN